ncbi:SPFH domain-containing protein [Vallitaleaceae bacterium 9-2]
MKKTGIIVAILVVVGLFVLANSLYIVKEDQVAVIKTFGKINDVIIAPDDEAKVRENLERNNYNNIQVISEKGLHFKRPFIDTVNHYSAKYLTYTSNTKLINTNDERRIEIEMYAQYRVLDPVVYSLAVGNKFEANKRMDEYVYKTVINSANTLKFDEFFYQNTLEELLDSKKETLNEQLVSEYGLFVTDIGINRKNFPQSNIANIEEKMAKEIEKESEKLIAEGDSEYIKAQSMTDRQRAEIISKAVEEAAVIKAEADAESIRIYQESLQKDLEFFQFIKRMEIYENIKGSTIFLDNDNAIFNYISGYPEGIQPN